MHDDSCPFPKGNCQRMRTRSARAFDRITSMPLIFAHPIFPSLRVHSRLKPPIRILKMVFSRVHLVLRVFQNVQNLEFLQKVTKKTKSHDYRPGPSFLSLPSVKSAGMG
jgi:hypothetical protein